MPQRPMWAFLLAIVAVALIMRGPFIGVAPLATVFRDEVGIASPEFGILTGIPILCFAFFSPLASWVGARIGPEMAISATALFVALGSLLRSLGPVPSVYAGTVIIGVAITIGNVMMPLIVRRDFPAERQTMAMGIYSATLNVGAFLASMVIVPLDHWLGWQLALGLAALAAIGALLLWVKTFGPSRTLHPHPVVAGVQTPGISKDQARLRGPVLWVTVLLTAGFAGQSSSYYGLTVWLPSYLHEAIGLDTASAGAGSSIFQVFGIAGALLVPSIIKALKPTATTVVIGLTWVSAPIGLLLAPQIWWLWSVTSGFGQGSGFTLIMLAAIKAASNHLQAARVSAIVQGVGYLFAGLAPFVIGGIHTASGSWPIALLVPLATTLTFITCTTFGVRWALKLEADRLKS